MFRLTREVRLAINPPPDRQIGSDPTNSFAGFPTLDFQGHFARIQITLEGQLNPNTGYLHDIHKIDRAARQLLADNAQNPPAPSRLFTSLRNSFPGTTLHSIAVWLSPFLSLTQLASEHDMYTRLSQKFEFSASHRLHNPALSDEQNRQIYGKCSHPNGHGHNYELQVTLRGKSKNNGLLVDVPAFERIVNQHVIDQFDHRNLNVDVPAFRELVPSVENIAMTIYRMLKGQFASIGAELAAVTVWETSKTWCEYSEENIE